MAVHNGGVLYDQMLTLYVEQAQLDAASRMIERKLDPEAAAEVKEMLGLE